MVGMRGSGPLFCLVDRVGAVKCYDGGVGGGLFWWWLNDARGRSSWGDWPREGSPASRSKAGGAAQLLGSQEGALKAMRPVDGDVPRTRGWGW